MIWMSPFFLASSKSISFGLFLYKRLAIFSVVASSTLPPYSPLNFIPLYLKGLWLAVIITPPAALLSFMARQTQGIGWMRSLKIILIPFPARIEATRRAYSWDRKRAS